MKKTNITQIKERNHILTGEMEETFSDNTTTTNNNNNNNNNTKNTYNLNHFSDWKKQTATVCLTSRQVVQFLSNIYVDMLFLTKQVEFENKNLIYCICFS